MKYFKDLKSKEEATNLALLLYDLYWLRYEKTGQQWFELTDFVREKLKEEGVELSYTDNDIEFRIDNGPKQSVKQDIMKPTTK